MLVRLDCGWWIAVIAGMAAMAGCQQVDDSAPVGKDGWLTGDSQAKLDTVAKHLRGNDLVMLEVEQRYRELLQAGQTGNWAYADYQVEKIRLAMEMGKERRPKRGTSYDWFFENGLPPMEKVVKEQDAAGFGKAFHDFTAACNQCHAMENVAHFHVVAPEHVDSIIGWPPETPAE